MKKKRGKSADKKKLNFKDEFHKSLHSFHSFFDTESLLGLILFLMAGLLFLSLKYSWIGIINWVIEFFTIFVLFIIFIKIPAKSKNKWIHITTKIMFVILLLIHFFLYLVNTIFLGDAIAMKYDLTSISLSSISFFFGNIFPLIYVFILIAFIIFSLVIVYYAEVIVKDYILKNFYKIFVLFLLISSLILVTNIENISNPYVNYFIQKQTSDSNFITIEKYPAQYSDFSYYDQSDWNFDDINLEDKNVFILIMEQSDLETYFKETEKIKDEENFFLQHRENMHLYSDYYTPNQDSRTSVWAMLNSEYMPFESYINGWNKKYGEILDNNNLVDFFNYKNYNTVVAFSFYPPGLILSIYNWTDMLHLTQENSEKEDFICIHNYKNQNGCEDSILLNDIDEAITKHKNKNIFFLQELIYGHGGEYMRLGKKSRIKYYNDYFIDLYEIIKDNKLENDSIILITSDHGEKGYFNKNISNFKIPLIVIDKDLNYKEINSTYNHVDFKEILFHYITNKEMPRPNKEIYFIGQTGSYELGYLNENNEYFIGNFKDRKDQFTYSLNFNNTANIQNKVKFLIDYREQMINLSSQKDYVCELCRYNRERAEIKYKK